MTNADFVIIAVISLTMMLGYLNLAEAKLYRRKKEYKVGDRVVISQKIVRHSSNTAKRIGKFIAYRDVTDTPDTDQVHIGFSICCSKDIADAKVETDLAMIRASFCYTNPLQIPSSITNDFIKFYGRSGVYFQGCTLPTKVQIYDNANKIYVDAEVNVVNAAVYIIEV
jgi:hypothetical protein